MKRRNNEILVVCDLQNVISEHMLQIITKARSLADESGYYVGVLCAGQDDGIQDIVAEYGADKLIIADTNKNNLWEYVDVLTKVIKDEQPKVILFQATDFGKNVAAIISARFETGLTADCIDITYSQDEGFAFVRAAICDSVIAQIKCINCDIHMGTVKEGVFVAKQVSPRRELVISKMKMFDNQYEEEVACLKTKELETTLDEINLNQYNIHFCIGRGASQYVDEIYELARKYNACVTGTRPIVEDGILERARQVGQSGKSIAPQIYVGFGVSGASQHLVGIINAKIIIAINNDPKAPIFDFADYVIVANAGDIVKELIKVD